MLHSSSRRLDDLLTGESGFTVTHCHDGPYRRVSAAFANYSHGESFAHKLGPKLGPHSPAQGSASS
jgi:hypothetical protein